MYWENKMRSRCEAKRMEIRIKRMNWKMYNVQALGFWKRMWRNEEGCCHFLYCVRIDDNHEIKIIHQVIETGDVLNFDLPPVIILENMSSYQ
jgi:hypothetical protein